MKKILFLPIVMTCMLAFSTAALAQVNWADLSKAQEMARQQHKKIMIKVYTNWCGWCKQMDANTFSNEFVSKYLNDNYICVKFNAESNEKVVFDGKTYGKTGSYHDLVSRWMGNQFVYPTTILLDENGNLIQAIQGYFAPNDFEKIATYFASNSHLSTPWQTYVQNYHRQNGNSK